MEIKKGQIINFPAPVPTAFKKAFEGEPAYITDPTVKPTVKTAGVVGNKLLKIWSNKPGQYEDILRAYANAPQLPGENLTNGADFIGDIGEIEEIEEPLPAHLETITKPFRRGQEYFLRRPERHELIYVGPMQLRTGEATLQSATENIISQPEQLQNNSQLDTNPYLRAPAELKKAT